MDNGLFIVRVIFTVLACVFAYFLFRAATDIDIRPWLAAGTFGCTICALLPWPNIR